MKISNNLFAYQLIIGVGIAILLSLSKAYANTSIMVPYFVCINNYSSQNISLSDPAFVNKKYMFNPDSLSSTFISTEYLATTTSNPLSPWKSNCATIMAESPRDMGIKFRVNTSEPSIPSNPPVMQPGIPGVTIPMLGSTKLEGYISTDTIYSSWSTQNYTFYCGMPDEPTFLNELCLLKMLGTPETPLLSSAYILNIHDSPQLYYCIQNLSSQKVDVGFQVDKGSSYTPISGFSSTNTKVSIPVGATGWQDYCVAVKNSPTAAMSVNFYNADGGSNFSTELPGGYFTGAADQPSPLTTGLQGMWTPSHYDPANQQSPETNVLVIQDQSRVYYCVQNSSSVAVTLEPSRDGWAWHQHSGFQDTSPKITIPAGATAWQDYCVYVLTDASPYSMGMKVFRDDGQTVSSHVHGYGQTTEYKIEENFSIRWVPVRWTQGDASSAAVNLFQITD